MRILTLKHSKYLFEEFDEVVMGRDAVGPSRNPGWTLRWDGGKGGSWRSTRRRPRADAKSRQWLMSRDGFRRMTVTRRGGAHSEGSPRSGRIREGGGRREAGSVRRAWQSMRILPRSYEELVTPCVGALRQVGCLVGQGPPGR